MASEIPINYDAVVRLTKCTDLAPRAVTRVAVIDGQELLTTKQIAEAMRAPYTHMAKAIAQLQYLRVIEEHRGRNGGLTLTEQGRNADVSALARALKGDGESGHMRGRASPAHWPVDARLRHASTRPR